MVGSFISGERRCLNTECDSIFRSINKYLSSRLEPPMWKYWGLVKKKKLKYLQIFCKLQSKIQFNLKCWVRPHRWQACSLTSPRVSICDPWFLKTFWSFLLDFTISVMVQFSYDLASEEANKTGLISSLSINSR